MFISCFRPDSAPQLSIAFKRILIPALLLFGSVIPQASAKCFQNLVQSPASPNAMSAAVPSSHAAVQSAAAVDAASIVGLWKATFTSGGQVVDVGFDAWHSDGTEILNDYTDPVEGNVCLGVWRQAGPRTYKLKHPSWVFDNTGTLLGTVIIHETVRLSADGNSYSGSYTYDVYDVSGAFVEEFTGDLSATRIKPD
jgi:hypothetical protein